MKKKIEPAPREVVVYCAGKIRKTREGWRPRKADRPEESASYYSEMDAEILVDCGMIGGSRVFYSGPFAYGCDHGCSHGPGTHGEDLNRTDVTGDSCQVCAGADHSKRRVWQRAVQGIAMAELVIVRPTLDSYGTLVEVGIAQQANCSIVVDLSEVPEDQRHDFWFVAMSHRCDDSDLEDVASAIIGYGPERWGKHAKRAKRIEKAHPLCESPIEEALYLALRRLDIDVQPQAPIGKYRADFLVAGMVVVECDGHAFHSTKDQRARDAARDRTLLGCGYPVMRFTGSEIHADADACARQVRDTLGTIVVHPINGTTPDPVPAPSVEAVIVPSRDWASVAKDARAVRGPLCKTPDDPNHSGCDSDCYPVDPNECYLCYEHERDVGYIDERRLCVHCADVVDDPSR